MAWKRQGRFYLNVVYMCWLCLVPFILSFCRATELTVRLWTHWKICLLWFFGSMVLNAAMFTWLKNSKINRGISNTVLDRSTTLQQYHAPWHGTGDPECGICLLEYEEGESVRIMACAHHFHAKCVDMWLQQYLNHCPFCRAVSEPTKVE